MRVFTGIQARIAVAVLLALTVLAALVWYGDALSLENLAAREAELRDYQREHPIRVYGMAFLLYVAVSPFAAAAVMTLLIGWFFGFVRGVILVSFASTIAAIMTFLLSRYLLRDLVQGQFGERLAGVNRVLEREGAIYLFALRLIPAVPFFATNILMGLTPIRTFTFWWVSQLGMLAGACVYVYAGTSVPDLGTLAEANVREILSPQLIVALVLLAFFPLAVKRIVQGLRRSAGTSGGA